ncbi:MAGa7180 family putative nuclease [Mycoplasmopsis gallinarum]|uniref:YqaJ viral recombinase domain-containing protein n=1 Tax=Mycoplasmopsis gallinarum TaxID=29557 RepID=A0A168RR00_9BACT|nr:hypothetical protein [Mycoplasmopsis gallinarum]OAB49203.1 hypothetical protein MGALLINA_00210 [Mycoplasmopsis gallinarum]
MARKYNGIDYFLDETAQVVKLSPEYHAQLLNSNSKFTKFKKFGGSSIGDIFETDSFKSPFNAFCFIARLKMPALQMKYINAGVYLEPKVFDFLRQYVYTDDKFDMQHIEAEKVNYDYFQNDEIIGGVPDGIIPKLSMVLEMKAVGMKKKDAWQKGNLPEDYKKQAQLYAHLLGYKYYSIVATYLNESDYTNLENVDFKTQTFAYNFNVNNEMAKDDIEIVKQFWKHYTTTGISPQYKLPRDNDQVAYLRCKNENEWKELFEYWKQIGKVDNDIEFSKVK